MATICDPIAGATRVTTHRRSKLHFCFLMTIVAGGSLSVASAAPLTLSGLTHQYSFDDGVGLTAVDSIGGVDIGLNGFAAGDSQWIGGVYGGALNFTSANSYAITNAPLPSGVVSISFWMLSTAAPNSNASALVTPQGGNWIVFDRGQGVGIANVHDANRPMRGIWENYVVTINQPAAEVSVYRDGVLSSSGTVDLPSTEKLWVFGHNQDLGNTNGSFHGALDEIQFYDRILTSTEAAELASRPPQPGTFAHLVTPAARFGLKPTGRYATASSVLFIDPAKTDWMAWNRFPDLRAVANATTGQLALGTYVPEVDDHFDLTVTNPVGQQMTVALDRNDGIGVPLGPQSVIFGTASSAPDVVRGDNWSSPSFFDEAGAFNSIFTVAGNYTFDFSFQNIGGDAGYPDIYLLEHTADGPGTIIGDVDFDGQLTASDISTIATAIRLRNPAALYDVNGDGEVTIEDHAFWVKDLKRTWLGDANLDGEFDSGDLVSVFRANQYENNVEDDSAWSTGDWDADGDFNSTDLVVALADGGYEAGQRPPAAATVPEPSGLMLVTGLLPLCWLRAKKGVCAKYLAA